MMEVSGKAGTSSSFQMNSFCVILLIIILAMPKLIHAQDDESGFLNKPPNQILLLLDFSELSCQFCLSSFLDLCDSLQSGRFNHVTILGILHFHSKNTIKDNSYYEKILRKQLRGFLKGNQISFPFLLDQHHIYTGMMGDGTKAIVTNGELGLIKAWKSPFNSDDIREICELLTIRE